MTGSVLSRWRFALGPLLLGSLMVNLFLIGGLLGERFTPMPTAAPIPQPQATAPAPTPGQRRQAQAPLREAIAQLPAEDRRLVNEVFVQHRPELRAARERVIGARARARELMAAEPVDAAALSSALADMREATAAVQGTTHGILVEATQRLSAESRRKLADSLRAQ